MVACPVMRSLLPAILLSGCQGLDRVPIVVGPHCEDDREEQLVACTLDGDTFNVGTCGGESVRLLGVNAPEIAHDETEQDECYGAEAAAWLEDLLAGEQIRLSFDVECTDRYDRTLAYAWLEDDDGDEILVNALLVREGMARVYEDFDDIRLAEMLYSAEGAAQADNSGLWAVCE